VDFPHFFPFNFLLLRWLAPLGEGNSKTQ
jgi:hypothetical protein